MGPNERRGTALQQLDHPPETPQTAVKDGANLLVVGRPIRDAEDPRVAAEVFAQAIAQGAASR